MEGSAGGKKAVTPGSVGPAGFRVVFATGLNGILVSWLYAGHGFFIPTSETS